eukprot:TRINITY_DN19514_c0_g1_i1.p1 TRINITY_DN19514_c0_g1~~TRINITY_DN19514_c0_g1_i1.p1  ORF type:complete len:206 (+),score=18.25 TRINITY_DN19514_c0_g1_i1:39-620(+)
MALRDALSKYPLPDSAINPAERTEDDRASMCDNIVADSLHVVQKSAWLEAAQEKAASGLGLSGLTTVMIRGVCPKLSQQSVKNLLDDDGFAGHYDFLYVPLRDGTGQNTAQAFVNFVSSEKAQRFYERYNGQNATFASPERRLSLLPASRQGYDANLRYFLHKSNASAPFFARHIHDELALTTEHSRDAIEPI